MNTAFLFHSFYSKFSFCRRSVESYYSQGIPGVPQIRNNYNPATWMLEVTSASTEAELGLDFSQIYEDSLLYE